MEKRILSYLAYLTDLAKNTSSNASTPADAEAKAKQILIQIGFFQHERLIHLIVTVTFAILTMMAILPSLFYPELPLFILCLLLLVLLIPYIRHYYILENSIQKMYALYDSMFDPWKKEQ